MEHNDRADEQATTATQRGAKVLASARTRMNGRWRQLALDRAEAEKLPNAIQKRARLVELDIQEDDLRLADRRLSTAEQNFCDATKPNERVL